MCGIAGVASRRAPETLQPILAQMAASMIHRGPDDEGFSIDQADGYSIGFAARRLAIQDASSAGHQPMRSERTGNCVALNGEIYNVAELRAALEHRGHRLVGHADTELVIRGYDEWGLDVLDRLRGMFALAIWDAEDRTLSIARDRLGIKPLYISRTGDSLAFASEIKTLLAGGLVTPEIDARGLRSYLALGAVQEPHTLLRGVEMLPAGSVLRWSEGRSSMCSFWSLEGAFTAEKRTVSRDEAVTEIRRLLEEAVRQHLVSDVPLGAFLSGGLDSSALVALVS